MIRIEKLYKRMLLGFVVFVIFLICDKAFGQTDFPLEEFRVVHPVVWISPDTFQNGSPDGSCYQVIKDPVKLFLPTSNQSNNLRVREVACKNDSTKTTN